VSEFRESVESRLGASGGEVTGHELLDAVGTLLKGGERFLKKLKLSWSRFSEILFSVPVF